MRLLIDTHALIWFAEADGQLSIHARQIMEDEQSELHYSVASIWELAIKLGLGKIRMGRQLQPTFRTLLERSGIEQLPIRYEHAVAVAELPRHHGDPFDRLLVVQAQLENMALVSQDDQMDAYDIQRVW